MSIRSNPSVHIAYASALIIAILFKMAGGKCNSQQAKSCRNGAQSSLKGSNNVASDQLNAIPPGGVCVANEYVGVFTHECTVTSFKPGVDYCCCQYQGRAMCCLYHQTWNRFRCNQEDDTIDTFPWKLNENSGSDGMSALSLPLLITLPIVIFLIIVIVFLACFWKRRRANRESRKDDDGLCSYKCCSPADRDSDEEDKERTDEITHQKSTSSPVVDRHFSGAVGLLGFPLHTAEKYPGPPPDREETTGLLPSAPPLPAEFDSYAVCDPKGERCSVVSAGENDYNPQSFRGLLPPPLYEHHHHHRPAPDC